VGGDAYDNYFFIYDPATDETVSEGPLNPIGLPSGVDMDKVFGLAKHPLTDIMYAVIGESGDRYLATVDLNTFTATVIGYTGIYVSDISFDATGTLYAISGENGPNTNSIHTLDLSTGAASFQATVGSGGGHAIAVNTDDGFIYHLYDDGDFERIDPSNGFAVSNIGLPGGNPIDNALSMVYAGNNIFFAGGDDDSEYRTLTTTGVFSSQEVEVPDYLGGIELTPNPVPLLVTDACDVTLTLISGPDNGASIPVNTQVTPIWVAVDQSGNSDTCMFNIGVNGDRLPPVIVCPADQSVISCDGQPVRAMYPDPSITDNCEGDFPPSYHVASGPTQGDTASFGLNVITLVASDASGNTDTCTFNYAVYPDTTAPVFDCPMDMLITSCSNGPEMVKYKTPEANDDCYSSLQDVLDPFNLGYTTISSVIPNQYLFEDGVTGDYIDDGGDDMYDDGNEINTNYESTIEYSDNTIVANGDFGPNGAYFTRKRPGLWLLAADLDSVTYFEITGDLGADGDGDVDTTSISTSH
jgi:hypothetical protein